MPAFLDWQEIALRLALASVAGALLGLNRTERDKPAGLRTSLLVCLAAAIAMIQANLLLATFGKRPDSYSIMDTLRLPLGVLTGIGFIGAGAIVRKGDSVEGVTTAAMLWLATIIGLSMGGGQIGLGLAGLGIGLFALSALNWVELKVTRDQHGTLVVTVNDEGPGDDAVKGELTAAGCRVKSSRIAIRSDTRPPLRTTEWKVCWRARPGESHAPAFLDRLAQSPGVLELSWEC
jgi:putative Mg2+ transporter-C (MgtC) family protein